MARPWHPRLTTWVDLVDARWHRLGLAAGRRRELRIDLVSDLSQARLDGAPLEELLAVDPDRFAIDVAIAHGWVSGDTDTDTDPVDRRSSPGGSPGSSARPVGREGVVTVARVVVAGLMGSIVGGVVALVVLLPLIAWVTRHAQFGSAPETFGILTIYATAALVAALSGGLAVASACADSPHRGRLLWRATLCLILSGVVATIVTVSFARSTGYSTRTPVLLTELGLVFGTLLVGLVITARRATPVRRAAVGHAK